MLQKLNILQPNHAGVFLPKNSNVGINYGCIKIEETELGKEMLYLTQETMLAIGSGCTDIALRKFINSSLKKQGIFATNNQWIHQNDFTF